MQNIESHIVEVRLGCWSVGSVVGVGGEMAVLDKFGSKKGLISRHVNRLKPTDISYPIGHNLEISLLGVKDMST